MKTLKLNYIIVALLALTFASCEKDYKSIERITYYPTFEMTGEADMVIKKGSGAFVDPGVIATEDGAELDVTTLVTSMFGESDVNTDLVDFYTITYSATNSDGYAGSTSRTVRVVNNGDLVNSLEGIYISDTGRSSESFTGLKWVVISERSAGTYALSHAMGGYYALGRMYGDGYDFRGSVITGSIGALTATDGIAPNWGNHTTPTAFIVDDGAKTIGFTSTADFGSVFTVLLTQDASFD
ncbi:MAG: DUF5011 domain-containing protein [Flavobacteriales bacterium]|nr:DUF5011 domain-containing protein [Flavobacteriales bacterium]